MVDTRFPKPTENIYDLKINLSPEPGKLVITPPSGYGMITDFTIHA